MKNTRVFIVDDHPVVRHGLRSLLSQYQDIQVVGEADSGTAALDLVSLSCPDVVLMDIRLSDCNGIDLARQMRRSMVEARIIILTAFDDDAYLAKAAEVGVHGYLLKSASADVLAETIRAVHAGERRISLAMADKAFQQLQVMCRSRPQYESGVTDEELQLLRLIADGSSVQDIAQVLYLSDRTVKRMTQNILVKLSATSRTQAVAEAFKRGLL